MQYDPFLSPNQSAHPRKGPEQKKVAKKRGKHYNQQHAKQRPAEPGLRMRQMERREALDDVSCPGRAAQHI